MRNPFGLITQGVIDRCKSSASYEADFDNVEEMLSVATALRSQGCRARCSASPLRLHVTVPWFYRIRTWAKKHRGLA